MDCRQYAAPSVAFLTLGILALACLGCGEGATRDTAHWAGKVTLDGEPVPATAQGAITFQPAAGNKGKAVTVAIVNGAYDSRITPRGQVTATVSLSMPTGKTYKSERTGQDVAELSPVTLSPEQSQGIALTVDGDEANHDFALISATSSFKTGG
jgi:hypothetical protein